MKNIVFALVAFFTINMFSQTNVDGTFFNDLDEFNGHELFLNGAGTRDKLYKMALYLDFEVNGVEDGIKVAEKDVTMAMTFKMSKNISDSEFKDIMRNGLEVATDGNSYLFETQIRDFLAFVPKKIEKFDILKLVYEKGGKLMLFKKNDLLGTINSKKFKQALFKVWLGENPIDDALKEKLLAAFQPEPILGLWKTFDKKTNVAISIVQLYIIEEKVYGTIKRMMRISERDAVCHKCEGDDKNKNVEGLVIVNRLKKKEENKYIEGRYTDINTGKVSSCQMWIDAEEDRDVLYVKYKGGGGTHTWKRVTK